ncbi:hypothetical protein OIU78_000655 [Salix suchowensis]|nr:hypothetical protein OIU78_000655 [Salix suchowensis]
MSVSSAERKLDTSPMSVSSSRRENSILLPCLSPPPERKIRYFSHVCLLRQKRILPALSSRIMNVCECDYERTVINLNGKGTWTFNSTRKVLLCGLFSRFMCW